MERIKKLKKEILQKTYQEREKILLEAKETKEKKLEEVLKEVSEKREKMMKEVEREGISLKEKFYSELEKEAPQFLISLAKKVFSQKELNDDFIQRIFSKK